MSASSSTGKVSCKRTELNLWIKTLIRWNKNLLTYLPTSVWLFKSHLHYISRFARASYGENHARLSFIAKFAKFAALAAEIANRRNHVFCGDVCFLLCEIWHMRWRRIFGGVADTIVADTISHIGRAFHHRTYDAMLVRRLMETRSDSINGKCQSQSVNKSIGRDDSSDLEMIRVAWLRFMGHQRV